MTKIYFVQAGHRGPIKIGITNVLIDKRVRGLQNGCPWRLAIRAVKDGTRADERAVHLKFHKFRLSGEWFLADREILDFIKTLRSPDFRWPALSSNARAQEASASGWGLEEGLRDNLLILADRFSEITGLKMSTISNRIAGDSRFFSSLDRANPSSFSARVYDRAMDKFEELWPEGVEMPEVWTPTAADLAGPFNPERTPPPPPLRFRRKRPAK